MNKCSLVTSIVEPLQAGFFPVSNLGVKIVMLLFDPNAYFGLKMFMSMLSKDSQNFCFPRKNALVSKYNQFISVTVCNALYSKF